MIKRMQSGIAGKELGFDYLSYVKEMAVIYGVVGTVFEQEDGTIKLIAEGEEKDLLEFAQKIENGSLTHRVENFYVNWEEPTGDFRDFSIGNIK